MRAARDESRARRAEGPGAGWRSVWVLANPRAGRGRGRPAAEAVVALLRRRGWEATLSFEMPDQAAIHDRPDAAVVVGGDGTLRLAVERLLKEFPDAPPPVLPLPMGTANLVGQYLGSVRSPFQSAIDQATELARPVLGEFLDGAQYAVADALPPKWSRQVRGPLRRLVRRALPPADLLARQAARQTVRALDAARVRHLDVGQANGRLFLLMAGVGFDAHVVHGMDARRTGPIGLMSYVRPAARAVAGAGFPAVRVDIDGRRLFGPRPAVVMIANLPQYGTGFPLIPGARGDDGLLDVLCLPCASRTDLGKLFLLAATGQHLDLAGAARGRGRRISVAADVRVPVQIDGDPGGFLPLEAHLTDLRLPLIEPAP